jgi:hypothetical protein
MTPLRKPSEFEGFPLFATGHWDAQGFFLTSLHRRSREFFQAFIIDF